MAEVRRRLIVNADDFGLSPGVTRGIREAVESGIVTSVSVMVNLPDWADTVALLRRTAPVPAIGLHLNLTTGAPLTRAESLVDRRTGDFLSFHRLALRAATRRIVTADVDAEVDAQLARLDDAGVAISHVDGHQHVHLLRIVWERVAQRASRRGLRIRVPAEPTMWGRDRPGVMLKKVALRTAARRAGAREMPGTTPHFRGLSLFGSRDHLAMLLLTLDTLPAGATELMVHPGYVDAELRARDGYLEMREVELRTLTAPTVRDRLASRDIQLERASANAVSS